MATRTRLIKLIASLLISLSLIGCATPSVEDSFRPVAALARDRLAGATVRWPQSDSERQQLQQIIHDKLKQPLMMDDAVQIALLNNRRLQANFAKLGIAVSELKSVSGLPDLSLSMARLRQGQSLELDRVVSFNLLSLLTRPWARQIEKHNLQQVRLDVMADMVNLAIETRQAWIEAVTAQQFESLAEQSNHTAQTARDTVERLRQVGNVSRLDLLREQALYADSQAEFASAQQHRIQRQATLTALMGLWGDDSNYRLATTLAPLPDSPRADNASEATSLQQRLDILAAISDSERLAHTLGMTRSQRFVDVLDLGYQHNRFSGQSAQHGVDVTLKIPLFTGGSRQQQAELRYQQSLDRAADIAIRARAEVRASYASYRLAYDTARHYRDQVLPVHAQISEEVLLRYNGMLLSVLDVLTNAREQAQTQQAAITAQRNFWLADTALDAAMTGTNSLSRTTTP